MVRRTLTFFSSYLKNYNNYINGVLAPEMFSQVLNLVKNS